MNFGDSHKNVTAESTLMLLYAMGIRNDNMLGYMNQVEQGQHRDEDLDVYKRQALYNVIGWKNLDDKPSYDDIMDRGTDISGLGSNGGGSAPEENWSCLLYTSFLKDLFIRKK